MALKSIFEALETIFEVWFEFYGVFWLGLAGNEEVAGDGLGRNGGSWLSQPSPVSAIAREVREKKKKNKTKNKKQKNQGRA